MRSFDIRRQFLDFFIQHQHTSIPSDSLVPEDSSLLFTNAGMVPFKTFFLNQSKPPAKRLVSVQRCLRAGGKHNDLDNVGFTSRHHSFFEMLGNFSFGDYFKEEAIGLAWQFLTEILELEIDRLWVTIYYEDEDAFQIWHKKIGLPESRILRLGESSNFWQMGETGPCGPSSEIFYDKGEAIEGGLPGTPNEDGDRFVEIWNLVFMQYNRQADGSLTPLPHPCVDTGMGLERITAVMQGVVSNYDTDLMKALIVNIRSKLQGCSHPNPAYLNVIVDHLRAMIFLIYDGVLPSNEGRGYVLRKIIRRALSHVLKLEQDIPFLSALIPQSIHLMEDEDLKIRQALIESTVLDEEMRFSETLLKAQPWVDEALKKAKNKKQAVSGETLFKLYDTYGYPMEYLRDLAQAQGLDLDEAGFELAMSAQKEQSRLHQSFQDMDYSAWGAMPSTVFLEDQPQCQAKILHLKHNSMDVQKLQEGQAGLIVLDNSVLYAEGGGQLADHGRILTQAGAIFQVMDVQNHQGASLHIGTLLKGTLEIGQSVKVDRDPVRRLSLARGHSATHLLHAALRAYLGDHVEQKGSWVGVESVRFDFSHPKALKASEIEAIEALVNQAIMYNSEVHVAHLSMAEAKAQGALALFEHKYRDQDVRVLSMGATDTLWSVELCGGMHVKRLGEIGGFSIVRESSVASGVRRIECLVGDQILQQLKSQQAILNAIGSLFSGKDMIQYPVMLGALLKENKVLKTQAHIHQKNTALSQSEEALKNSIPLQQDYQLLFACVANLESKAFREWMDYLREISRQSIICLSNAQEGKLQLLIGLSHDSSPDLDVRKLASELAKKLGGKAGGRRDLAQGGASDVRQVKAVFDSLKDWAEPLLFE